MIILAKYEKLPPEGTKKGNRTLAALTCESKVSNWNESQKYAKAIQNCP